jgi:hypothetical protein
MFEYECWKCNEWHDLGEDVSQLEAFDWGYDLQIDVRATDTKESIIGKDRYWLEEANGKA